MAGQGAALSGVPLAWTILRERMADAFGGPGGGIPHPQGRRRCFFVVHNKNHLTIYSQFAPALAAAGLELHYTTIGSHRHVQKAVDALNASKVAFGDINHIRRHATRADVVIVGMDFGPKRLVRFLKAMRRRGVPTLGVVDGARFLQPKCYKNVDELLCWGPSGLSVGARRTTIVGSPMIERAAQVKTSKSGLPRALVNYKFSGTLQDSGFVWGAAAIAAAQAIDPNYVLSTHPNSRGVPDSVRVSHAPFDQLLKEASVVITSASTVIYEALAAGVAVIYFPMPDEDPVEFGTPMGAFTTAQSASELLEHARAFAADPRYPDEGANAFLAAHVSVDGARPAKERIAERILAVLSERPAMHGEAQ
jgi:hypothetical protein